jgi:hypothetical protein
MTITELRALYFEGVKIVRAERRMRAYVFRDKPELMEAKLREMDRLLVILEQIKDAAKADTEAEQGTLLDVPHKYE